MFRGATLVALALALPSLALASTFTPLAPGIVWTYEGVPPVQGIRLHALGAFQVWNGQAGYPQAEIQNGVVLPTTHWAHDANDRLVLQGVDWGSPAYGGTWYFDPAPVFADGSLQPGQHIVATAGVWEVTEMGDQWYGERELEVRCLDRGPVTTPYGEVLGVRLRVDWIDSPTAGPWTYGANEVRTYAFGLGLVEIASTVNPDVVYALTEVTGLEISAAAPPSPALTLTAAPTPFNPATTLRFAQPAAGHAELAVFDLAGRRVAMLVSGHLPAGPHAIDWRPTDLASGVYLARLVTGGGAATTRLTLLE